MRRSNNINKGLTEKASSRSLKLAQLCDDPSTTKQGADARHTSVTKRGISNGFPMATSHPPAQRLDPVTNTSVVVSFKDSRGRLSKTQAVSTCQFGDSTWERKQDVVGVLPHNTELCGANPMWGPRIWAS